MLSQAGTQLYRFHMIDFDPFPLGKSYLDRALSIQPDLPQAQEAHAVLGLIEDDREYERVVKGRRPEQALAEVGESERLEILPILMQESYRRNKLEESEARARELLTLAAHFPHHRNFANFLFKANMLLGKIAMRRGDKRKAGMYLLEAANSPRSEQLSYIQILMELPRSLIDWGERDTVASFLERCATFNFDKKQLTEWADQIRHGVNPNLIPSAMGCANAPC